MKLSKLTIYSLLVMVIGGNSQCAPEDWKYMTREYVVHKDLSTTIPLAGASAQTQTLFISSRQINNALGLTEQLDGKWFGEREMGITLKSVKVESCAVDVKILADNQATSLYLEGVVNNKPLFNGSAKPIPLNEIVLLPLTTALNFTAVDDIQKTITENLNLRNKDLLITYKATPQPANKAARATIILDLVVTAVYDVCQLMPPGSGDRECR